MIRYYTIAREASAEQTINRSRFIAYIKPVENRAEADSFIAEIRKKHRDATHNVPAIVLGDKMQIQWASDDGEPQGTSGAPMVQLLVQEGITNIAVVVTRYFGGIKLGTGGLVRAYSSSLRLALEEAGVKAVAELAVLNCRVSYNQWPRLQSKAGTDYDHDSPGFCLGNIRYSEQVEAELLCSPEHLDWLKALLSDITGGTAEILSETMTMR